MRRTTRRGSSRGKDRAWWLKSPKISTGFYPTEPNVAFDVLLSEQTYDWRPCKNHTAHESGIDMSKRRKITNKVRMNEKKTQEGRREVMLVYGQGGMGTTGKTWARGSTPYSFHFFQAFVSFEPSKSLRIVHSIHKLKQERILCRALMFYSSIFFFIKA